MSLSSVGFSLSERAELRKRQVDEQVTHFAQTLSQQANAFARRDEGQWFDRCCHSLSLSLHFDVFLSMRKLFEDLLLSTSDCELHRHFSDTSSCRRAQLHYCLRSTPLGLRIDVETTIHLFLLTKFH